MLSCLPHQQQQQWWEQQQAQALASEAQQQLQCLQQEEQREGVGHQEQTQAQADPLGDESGGEKSPDVGKGSGPAELAAHEVAIPGIEAVLGLLEHEAPTSVAAAAASASKSQSTTVPADPESCGAALLAPQPTQEQQAKPSAKASSNAAAASASALEKGEKEKAESCAAASSSAAGAHHHGAGGSLGALTPWIGFRPSAVEEQYMMFKHREGLSTDYGCAVFILGFILALLGRFVIGAEQDHWNTFGYMMYLVFKLVAYVPLLLGYKEIHLR
jgi:hypothetical protein